MNGSCSTGELGAESGRLQAWALWKLSSGRPGWTKGRCPAVRSCSPFFPDTRSCESCHCGPDLALVPPSPKRELGPQWPPLSRWADPPPRPSRTGSDTPAKVWTPNADPRPQPSPLPALPPGSRGSRPGLAGYLTGKCLRSH